MNRPSIIFRPAQATVDDGLAFARYLDQAAEGFFGFMLGRRSAKILATAFLQPGHDLSYQHVTFAQLSEVIVGMVSGYTAEQHRQASGRPLMRAAGLGILRMWAVSLLFAPLLRVIDSVDDGDFYLQAIAVDGELRGEGIGSQLLDFIEDKAVASGATRIALDVSAGNSGARNLYERRGMTVASKWPKRLIIPGFSLLRIAKAL